MHNILWFCLYLFTSSFSQLTAATIVTDPILPDLEPNTPQNCTAYTTANFKDIPIYPMPQTWQSRDDVFGNDTSTLNYLLAKTKPSHLSCINRTTQPITLVVHTVDASKNSITIQPNSFICLPFSPKNSLSLDSESTGYFNFFEKDTQYFLSIESQRCLLFPRPMDDFNFIPSRPEKKFNNFSRIILRDEGIDRDEFYAQRQRLYHKSKIEKFFDQPLPLQPKIPLNLFSVWLTNPAQPVEPEAFYLDLALKSSEINPPRDGWKQYFVVNDVTLFPKTCDRFKDTPIQVISIQDLIGTLELQAEFDQCMHNKRFAAASDILRVELLYKLGGAYLDIDLVVLQSLKPLFFLYDSLLGLEPFSLELAANAFMAEKPGHSIMKTALNLIKRNFDGNLIKRYIKEAPNYAEKTIRQTGPIVISLAYFKAKHKEDDINYLAPPALFCPMVSEAAYNAPLDSKTATLHLWHGTWGGEKGKKNDCFG